MTLSVKFVFKHYFKMLFFKNDQNMPTTGLKHRYEFYKILEIDLTSFGVIKEINKTEKKKRKT